MSKAQKVHVHAPEFQGCAFLRLAKRRRQRRTPMLEDPKTARKYQHTNIDKQHQQKHALYMLQNSGEVLFSEVGEASQTVPLIRTVLGNHNTNKNKSEHQQAVNNQHKI